MTSLGISSRVVDVDVRKCQGLGAIYREGLDWCILDIQAGDGGSGQ